MLFVKRENSIEFTQKAFFVSQPKIRDDSMLITLATADSGESGPCRFRRTGAETLLRTAVSRTTQGRQRRIFVVEFSIDDAANEQHVVTGRGQGIFETALEGRDTGF